MPFIVLCTICYATCTWMFMLNGYCKIYNTVVTQTKWVGWIRGIRVAARTQATPKRHLGLIIGQLIIKKCADIGPFLLRHCC